MRRLASAVLLGLIAGCAESAPTPAPPVGPVTPGSAARPAPRPATLAEARRGFATRLVEPHQPGDPLPTPPAGVFELVRYKSPAGDLAAYLTPDPGDGAKHPAIVWITGGDCNSIGDVWGDAPRENDQNASAYRKAGVIMMFPSLRGGNDNPGRREGFLGEVDDVLAATDYLAARPYVDPKRIYLGGHSTGGTLAMLVAEMSPRYRAVFAFGPVPDVRNYGGQFIYHEPGEAKESEVRSPGYWLGSVASPLFALEGAGGNIRALEAMKSLSTNPKIRFLTVPGKDHFSVLAPANERIAAKILADGESSSGIAITEAEATEIGSR